MSENLFREASFVVRIFWDRQAKDALKWRGQVIHAPTQQSVYFERLQDLHEFLDQWTGIMHSIEPPFGGS
jgi:hypothetical protein